MPSTEAVLMGTSRVLAKAELCEGTRRRRRRAPRLAFVNLVAPPSSSVRTDLREDTFRPCVRQPVRLGDGFACDLTVVDIEPGPQVRIVHQRLTPAFVRLRDGKRK